MDQDVSIAGVPFASLFERDGRFIRGPGLFAFARREGDRRVLLHLELTGAINHRAGPGHPRWAWALSQGMNELLVCLAAARMAARGRGCAAGLAWHPDAAVWFTEADMRGSTAPAEAGPSDILSRAGR
jgi:hypothetical protein